MRFVALLVSLCAGAQAARCEWVAVRSPHFEIYSQAGEASGQAALQWFERLRAFFAQTGQKLDDGRPVRVIGFASQRDYEAFRLRPIADAYYLATEARDTIVMPSLGLEEFRVAAHEYAHLVLHANGIELAPWLGEGLAEYFSTIRIDARECRVGGPILAHLQTLRRRVWLPLPQVLAMSENGEAGESRDEAALFYAESWALVDMLLESPKYRPQFAESLADLKMNAPVVAADLRAWVRAGKMSPVELPGVALHDYEIEVRELRPAEERTLLDELHGAIAFGKNDYETARREFEQAIQEGQADAPLLYEYAEVADETDVADAKIRAALEHAIELKPDFDQARFRLGLRESNRGEYAAAVAQLRAMRSVDPKRTYTYWTALAYALGELGRRGEAVKAAEQAQKHAATPAERARAAQLAYLAETDVAVRFTRDAQGQLRLETTRVPHGAEWNPFVEAGDTIRRAEGKLLRVECSPKQVTGVAVETGEGTLRLSISDPTHVLMRNAPAEFACGPQQARAVRVEYAVGAQQAQWNGALRGMEFR